ncbi:hypothetical protein [Streptomyces pseudogriseolus]|uniref:hypothetical protein n=1 Tax=Streptomyces pseudogriseolus TaxID=36817 RepID=UPI003FA2D6C2
MGFALAVGAVSLGPQAPPLHHAGCSASSGEKEAVKSSVLKIILSCLRGRSGLQRDVQSWLRRVRTEFVLDDETLVTRTVCEKVGLRRRPD